MNPDRHIYITTAVLAVVLATAINVLTPRDPFAGTIVHRDAGAAAAPPSATAASVEVAARAPAAPQRSGTPL